MFFKKKKEIKPESVTKEPSVLDVSHIKGDLLNQYVVSLRKMRPSNVIKTVTSQYRFISIAYILSIFFFIAGMLVTWQKNLAVNVIYQRIDGVAIDIPNDPRSRVLLTKVLQDAKITKPRNTYNLKEENQ